MIEILFIALVAASLTMFLNYCMGKPSDEFSPHEIFSKYTVWLSILRLKKVGLWPQYEKQYLDSVNGKTKEYDVRQIQSDFHKIIYNAADPFFTWERAAGMCPVCTGFWITLITAILHKIISTNGHNILIYENLLYLVSVIVISHVFIRVINKVI